MTKYLLLNIFTFIYTLVKIDQLCQNYINFVHTFQIGNYPNNQTIVKLF